MNDQPTNRRKIFLSIIIFANIILAFAAGYIVASYRGVHTLLFDQNGAVSITAVTNLYEKTRSDKVSFDQFWHVWDQVKKQYVNQPADEVKMFYGAIEGMVAGLGDPYSVYFPPEKAKEFTTELSGEFGGIGAEIGKKSEQLVVIAPLPKSPAELAGIKPGDKIYAINGESTSGLAVDVAANKIRGQKGTVVTLTLSHANKDAIFDLKITRDIITIPTVMSEMKKNNIAYIRIALFNKDTWHDFDKALNELLPKSPKGLVLDLRSNPGGYLDSAVQIASEWVESGTIVRQRLSVGPAQESTTLGTHRLANMPTVVLIDGGSASAAEIVSGALQDHKKATLLGQKTFGKGSVQSFDVLPDGSALKVTIAKWFTPNDRQIHEKGIEPDIFINLASSTPKVAVDTELDKALEILGKNDIKK